MPKLPGIQGDGYRRGDGLQCFKNSEIPFLEMEPYTVMQCFGPSGMPVFVVLVGITQTAKSVNNRVAL